LLFYFLLRWDENPGVRAEHEVRDQRANAS